MSQWIPEAAAAAYRWEPRLGGFRKTRAGSPNVALRHPSFRGYADYMETDEFARALAQLLADAADAQTAVMCSESLWWRCHRRLIADAAQLLHGVPVRHLMHDGSLRPHQQTAGVRVTLGRNAPLRRDVILSGGVRSAAVEGSKRRYSALTAAVSASTDAFASPKSIEVVRHLVERIFDAGKTRAHRAFEHDDVGRLVDVEDRHAVNRRTLDVAGGWIRHVVRADDQRDVGRGELRD